MAVKSASDLMKVYNTPWQHVGSVIDFLINEPQVLLDPKFIYILRSKNGFRIFDMECGGQYEWKVSAGQLLIRRRLSEHRTKTADKVKLISAKF